MGLKRLDLAKCNGCEWYFSYDKEDIEVVSHGMRYRIFCPNCGSEYRIAPSIYVDLYPDGRPGEVEKQVERTSRDTKTKEYQQALEAQETLHTKKTQAAAAKELGISVTELRNRLKRLPAEAVAE